MTVNNLIVEFIKNLCDDNYADAEQNLQNIVNAKIEQRMADAETEQDQEGDTKGA